MVEDNYGHRHSFWRYLGLFVAVLLGSFLAVCLITDIAINRMMNPYIAMHKMDKEFRKMEREMAAPLPMREHFGASTMRAGGVEFIRTPHDYRFIVDLKPFNNNPDNINIETNGSNINISGESTVDKKHSETFTSFSQSYTLDNADFDKMTKKKVANRYIITVPIED